MRPVVVALAVVALCVANSSEAVADEQNAVISETSILMTNRELYEDCKQAIAYAEANDLSSFARTYCIAQITGYVAAFIRAEGAAQIAALDEPSECAAKRHEILQHIRTTFCIPKSWQKKNIYLLIAKEYVAYIDGHKQSLENRGLWEEPPEMGMSLSIFAPKECP